MPTKGQRRAAKVAAEFDMDPPRCGTCASYKPPQPGVPGLFQYVLPYCNRNEFSVKPFSACKHWAAFKGNPIESHKA